MPHQSGYADDESVWKGLIEERHRHRYEFNNKFREVYMEHGAIFSGQSPDGTLVEAMEIPGHPFYLGVQYHPEFKEPPEPRTSDLPGVCESGSGGKGKNS